MNMGYPIEYSDGCMSLKCQVGSLGYSFCLWQKCENHKENFLYVSLNVEDVQRSCEFYESIGMVCEMSEHEVWEDQCHVPTKGTKQQRLTFCKKCWFVWFVDVLTGLIGGHILHRNLDYPATAEPTWTTKLALRCENKPCRWPLCARPRGGVFPNIYAAQNLNRSALKPHCSLTFSIFVNRPFLLYYTRW